MVFLFQYVDIKENGKVRRLKIFVLREKPQILSKFNLIWSGIVVPALIRNKISVQSQPASVSTRWELLCPFTRAFQVGYCVLFLWCIMIMRGALSK